MPPVQDHPSIHQTTFSLTLSHASRRAVSVTLSGHERRKDPDNAYLGVTEPHAWKLLEWFEGRPDAERRAALLPAEGAS